jgi:hypothetical protein
MSAGVAWRRYVATELGRYWPRGLDAVLRLAVPAAPADVPMPLPPRFETVRLPDWAAELGVAGALLVPSQCIVPGEGEAWQRTDWWSAAAWFLTGAAERAHESTHGPIHSYSGRLQGWDARMWDHAWVNRMALFLRRRAARELEQEEHALFGALPAPEIMLTHDVDAIRKTAAIRFKQSAFRGYQAARLAGRGRFARALDRLGGAARFLLTSPDYWHFDEIERAEETARVRSCFFVYGGDPRRRSLKQALLDPGYDVREPRLAERLRALAARGWPVGLHQSFDAWRDGAAMAREKARVEEAISSPVTLCRQHWLRFGWSETWKAQADAGLETDATLGFNDRSGFRNGAALRFRPWDEATGAPLKLASVPMVLMDSQLYDYSELTDEERERQIARWMGEVRAVAGVATIIWHQHVLGPDYGWRAGLDALMARMAQPA